MQPSQKGECSVDKTKVKYFLKRILLSVLVLLIASFLSFVLIRMVPGNPAELILGENATPERIVAMEEKMGLDKPIIVQFFLYIVDVLHGDFGTSSHYNIACSELLATRLPATILLTACATLISVLVAFPLGICASIKKGSAVDFLAVLFALIGGSVTPVWLGLFLILLFSVKLQWLPTQGYGSIKNVILPSITMGYAMAASITRQLRSGMFDVLEEDYITASYARGISRGKVYSKYALKNAILPVMTIIGSQVASMLAGSVVTESVFGWPGIGSLLISSISTRDYALLQAVLLVCSAMFIVVNMVVDFLYTLIDPRLRFK